MVLIYLMNFIKKHWILHEMTTPYSHEMNDRVERKNITPDELVVVILLNFGYESYW